MAEEKKTTKKPAAKKPAAKKPAAKKVPAKAAAAKPVAKKSAGPRRAEERRDAKTKRPDGYYYAVGRRKRAVAQCKLWPEQKKLEISVNGKGYEEYFSRFDVLDQVLAPLKAVGLDESVKIEIKVVGGGLVGQAEAAKLAIARAMLVLNPEYRLSIKKLGYLTRDPREKERKKPGLRKARRAPQWSKR